MSTDNETRELLRNLFDANDRATEHAHAVFDALRARPQLRKRQTLVRYHCPNKRRCLLLTVFRCPLPEHAGETMFYKESHKLSFTLNEQASNAEGRAKNSVDGENHWPAQASDIRQLLGHGDTGGVHGSCDHLNTLITSNTLEADIEAAQFGDTPIVRTVYPRGN